MTTNELASRQQTRPEILDQGENPLQHNLKQKEVLAGTKYSTVAMTGIATAVLAACGGGGGGDATGAAQPCASRDTTPKAPAFRTNRRSWDMVAA